MAEVVGLGQNALVEGEPGEFSVYETCLGMEVNRLNLDRLRRGSHFRSPDGCSKRILSPGRGTVMSQPDCPSRQPAGPSREPSVKRIWLTCGLIARRGDRLCIICTCCGMPSRAGSRMLRITSAG